MERRNRAAGIAVDATAITPRWYGDPLDLGHITTALWCADQREGAASGPSELTVRGTRRRRLDRDGYPGAKMGRCTRRR